MRRAVQSYAGRVSRRYPAQVYTEHLRIPVGGGALHVERTGRAGPAVVLLHGFGTCAFLWRAIAPRLAEAGLTAIAIDLLGHGESDRPTDVPYGIGAQAEYVERALTALRLGEVTIVGQDLGALVALMLAEQQPRRVARLALLEPLDPLDLPGPAIRSVQRTSALTALTANTLFGARPLLEPLLRGALAGALWALVDTASESAAGGQPDAHERRAQTDGGGHAAPSERLVARYLAPFVGAGGAAELLQLASTVTLTDDEVQRLADLTGEVLLWMGADDEAGAGRESAVNVRLATWTRLLPAATLRPIVTTGASGQLVAESQPAALAATLCRWLA